MGRSTCFFINSINCKFILKITATNQYAIKNDVLLIKNLPQNLNFDDKLLFN